MSGSSVVALCLLLVSLVACGGRAAADPVPAEVQRVLDRRAEAVLDHDRAAYTRTGTGAGFDNLGEVPLAAWSYRVTGVDRTGDTATADVELRYRIEGHDRGPVTTGRTVRLSRTGGRAVDRRLDRPAKRSGQQPGPGRGRGRPRACTASCSASDSPPGRCAATGPSPTGRCRPGRTPGTAIWARRVVVLVRSRRRMAACSAPASSSYRGIAAVTGETGGREQAPADRIIVNPDAYGPSATWANRSLTHETTHVATRADTSPPPPPLWLSEGYADWVGYRDGDRAPAEAAPEMAGAVAEGRVPASLPTDEDFGFTADADELARAYEGGWLACRMIADQWGEDRLDAFHRAVGGHEKRAGAVEDAMNEVLADDAGGVHGTVAGVSAGGVRLRSPRSRRLTGPRGRRPLRRRPVPLSVRAARGGGVGTGVPARCRVAPQGAGREERRGDQQSVADDEQRDAERVARDDLREPDRELQHRHQARRQHQGDRHSHAARAEAPADRARRRSATPCTAD